MANARLSPAVRAFLEEPRFAILATINPDGSPQQSVMWYRLDGDCVMMNTSRGRVKDRNLTRDPRASICVEDGYRFVTISGRVQLIDDQSQAKADIHALAVRYHGPERADEMMREQFSKQQRVTIQLSIDRVVASGFDE
ncbi:MAG TPA: PPOX class F420-dependent oxidoreductase [Thermomicrobiales bacterium]|jgi:PPOX class probable F420-dependent enzyme